MFRAVETYRWGGGAFLVGGVIMAVLGLTGADPRADMFVGALGGLAAGLLAGLAWWLLRRVARAIPASCAEASLRSRVLRIAMICAIPSILILSAALYPTRSTWAVGVILAASGVVQLAVAAKAVRLERRCGAIVLHRDGGVFVLAH